MILIIKGDNVSTPTKIKKTRENIDKTNQAKEDGTYYTAYHMDSYNVAAGLKAYYADDGFLKDIVYSDNIFNSLAVEQIFPNLNLTRLETRSPSLYDTLLYQWDVHQNQIWQIGNTTGRLGSGRITTFFDKYGQRDNILKKGDCETSLAYDNCVFGTEILVHTPNSSGNIHYQTLYKKDVGGLPDAVLDIWKIGVEYWDIAGAAHFLCLTR